MAQPETLQRTGRGGAGNFRRPSNDPDNTSSAKAIIKEMKNPAPAAATSSRVEYVHHGRGGAGNLSTTSGTVAPVQSVVDEKTPQTIKAVTAGRGGAGNIRPASRERISLDGSLARGNVVDVPGTTAAATGDEKAVQAVLEPEQAFLGEGREVVRDSTAATTAAAV